MGWTAAGPAGGAGRSCASSAAAGSSCCRACSRRGTSSAASTPSFRPPRAGTRRRRWPSSSPWSWTCWTARSPASPRPPPSSGWSSTRWPTSSPSASRRRSCSICSRWHGSGAWRWLGAFLFVTCGALRLARFNVYSGVSDRRYFVGLPIPAAAGIVAAVMLLLGNDELERWQAAAIAVGTYVVALLMVSTFRYYTFKELDFARRRPVRRAPGGRPGDPDRRHAPAVLLFLLFSRIRPERPARSGCGRAAHGSERSMMREGE